MARKIIFICTLLSLLQVPSNAQQYTLQQCIEIGMKNNIQIQQNNLQVSAAEIGHQRAKQSLLPSLSGNASQGFHFGRSLDPTTNTFIDQQMQTNTFQIASQVTLFNGFRLIHNIQQGKANLHASQYEYQVYRNEVMLNILQAFVQVLYNKELLKVRQNQVVVSKAQYSKTNSMVNAGTLAEGDMYEFKAKMASDELAVINAENDLNLAKLNLIQMMNIPYSNDQYDSFDIETPLMKIDNSNYTTSVSEIYLEAENVQPMIKSSKYRLRSSEHGVQASKSSFYPWISLNGNIYTNYSSISRMYTGTHNGIPHFSEYPWRSQINNNLAQSISLNLFLPIYSNNQTRSNVQMAEISRKNASLDLDNKKVQLRKDVEQAWMDVKAANKRYEATAAQNKALGEASRVAEKRLNAGFSNALPYIISSNNLQSSNSDLLQAKYNLYLKTKILEFYKAGGIEL